MSISSATFKGKISKNHYSKYLLWGIWILFALITIIAKLDTPPSSGNVFNIYREAGIDWRNGDELYDSKRFLYFPTAAIPFAPLSTLSFKSGGAIWRLVNILVFALGIFFITKSATRKPSHQVGMFALSSIIAVALSWSAARHAQMTLMMSGTMMLACVLLERKRWFAAGVCLATAVALKPLAVALLLVAVVVYPKVIFSTVLSLIFFLLLPFVTQDSSYVLQQYLEFPEVLKIAATRAQTHPFVQIFWLFKSFGLSVSENFQLIIRGFFALLTLIAAWQMHIERTKIPAAIMIYAILSSYILLFGCGTEANTYAMIAPAVGILLSDSLKNKNRREIFGYTLALTLLLVSRYFSNTFPGTPLAMFKPYATLIVTGLIISRLEFGNNPLRKAIGKMLSVSKAQRSCPAPSAQ